MSPSPLPLSRSLSHTDLSALDTKASAAQNAGSGSLSIFQRKTKSTRSQFAGRRERHAVNPVPTSPPPTKKNAPFPTSPFSSLLQALAIPGVLLHGELSCDKRLVVFNN